MSETCETVKIVSSTAPGGFVVINASDFDLAQHKIVGLAEEKTDTTEVKLEEKKKAGRQKNR